MIIRLFVLVSLFMVAACARQAPVPSDQYHRLPEAVTDNCPSSPLSDGVIRIGQLRADGLHMERAMLYSEVDDELTLKQYHYHYWVDSPPSMIRARMVEFLRNTSAAPMVVSDHDIEADLIVSGRIKRFESAFQAQGSVVYVALELRVDEKDSNPPLLVEDYSAAIATSGDAIQDEVLAYREGLDNIFCRLQSDIHRRHQSTP